ncbi:MAG: hypothetical protein E7Z97_07290 [Propionibacteriaceae bacterium]|nr:hypothetical protein [Propionibacteriaceae bacterium]
MRVGGVMGSSATSPRLALAGASTVLVIAVLQAIWSVARGLEHGANVVSLTAAIAMIGCAALTIWGVRSPGRRVTSRPARSEPAS